VSQMCLGAMMFGAFGNSDHEDAAKIIHKALDAGINFIDTADGYSAGESEEILGKALADGRRESVVLAVKFGVPFGDEDPNHRGASRRWITEAVEGSLRRLRTDWIDLYQVGVPDPGTDIDETLGALSDLVRAGKIRSFGASKVPASQIVEAQLTLIQMAVAFVTRHPAVTSAIIGPRTMEHLDSYLAADGTELSVDVLDRIDEIVAPGVTINVADNMWNVGTTALDAAFRRRQGNLPGH